MKQPLIVLLIVILGGAVRVAVAQEVRIDSQDHGAIERWEHAQELIIAANALFKEGHSDDAFALLEDAYATSLNVNDSAASFVAYTVGGSHEVRGDRDAALVWLERAITRIPPRTKASAGTGVIGMRYANVLAASGQREKAVEAYRGVVGPDTPARTAHAAHERAASLLVEMGEPDEASEAFALAIDALESSGDTGRAHMHLRIRRVLHTTPRNDPGDAAMASTFASIYNDPRYVDLAERLDFAGRMAVTYASRANDGELVENVARDVFFQAQRFEEILGRERAIEMGVGEAYMECAIGLAWTLFADGRAFEAAEILETARDAYPDARRVAQTNAQLRFFYDQLGIEEHDLPPLDPGAPGLVVASRDGSIVTYGNVQGEIDGVPVEAVAMPAGAGGPRNAPRLSDTVPTTPARPQRSEPDRDAASSMKEERKAPVLPFVIGACVIASGIILLRLRRG